MQVRLYNTLTHSVEPFEPVESGVVRMYHCGPTVYDLAHIGNFRSFLLADLLRRFFEFIGYRVEQVMNITDVGHMTDDASADGAGQDKMAAAAERLKQAKKSGRGAPVENPDDPYQIADYYTGAFVEDARALRLRIADDGAERMPRATAHVREMIDLIVRLIGSGHAYVTPSGAVYYDVASFPDYGRLSGNTLEKLREGAGGRVSAADQAGKRNPADFLLWKRDESHLMKWPSPWGAGYPGWHIECSAMAMCTLGAETLDIHTGGEDNIFPHHECEIAQSTGATGKPFARYWLHARHLLVEGRKMSKSAGNFFTLRNLLDKGEILRVDMAALRYELLKTHYRSNANFTAKGLDDSDRMIRRLREFAGDEAGKKEYDEPATIGATQIEQDFASALADDLNISAALGELNKWIRAISFPTAVDQAALRRINSVLGVVGPSEQRVRVPVAEDVRERQDNEPTEAKAEVPLYMVGTYSDEKIEAMCERIRAARAARDYKSSDAIRDELTAAGIEVQITREGVTWRRKVKL